MATMAEIARRAGVSRTTVSYVLNDRQRNDGTIGEQTRRRVLDAAAALGYRKNELARAVVTGRAPMLAALTGYWSLEHTARILEGAADVANERGYVLKVIHLRDGVITEEAVASCLKWSVSGVLCIHADQDSLDSLRQPLSDRNIPIAVVDNVHHRPWGARIVSDDGQGIRLAVEHLASLGHRRIALLNGAPESPASQWREASFRTQLSERGFALQEGWIVPSAWTDADRIEEAARRLLRQPNLPTAVICAGDAIAMCLLRVARAAGFRLPEQLSVTGYADFHLARFADPALTSVAQPFRLMGATAARYLIARSRADTTDGDSDTLLPNRLVVRASTAPPWNP